MGYTHYWKQKKTFTKAQWGKLCEVARAVVKESNADGNTLVREFDEADTQPQIDDNVIRFNGVAEDGHETFMLTRKKPPKDAWVDAEEYRTEGAFNFCKTARKDYDAAVVSMLAWAVKIAPNAISASSDGGDEAIEIIYGKGAVKVRKPRVSKKQREREQREKALEAYAGSTVNMARFAMLDREAA